MNIIKTAIEGLLIIEPKLFGDNRGYFCETWNSNTFRQAGLDCTFVQDNESMSAYGVIRGLHYQKQPYAQAKLVRAIVGRILDIALDIRKDSPTFGQHVAVELSADNKRQLFIPKGFAHGFSVLSQVAVFAYKCDDFYTPEAERGIAFNDPQLAIDWKIPPNEQILSAKDTAHPTLTNADLF